MSYLSSRSLAVEVSPSYLLKVAVTLLAFSPLVFQILASGFLLCLSLSPLI